MGHEIVSIEARKLEYLLKKCDITMEYVNRIFEEVDAKMANVTVGSKLYDNCGWDTFELIVTALVDKSRGIVAVMEPGYTGHEHDIRKENIMFLTLKP